MNEPIMTINVRTYEVQALESANERIVMIPFSADASGKYFTGKTIQNGIDTQIATKNGFSLSARYMLAGHDMYGNECKIYIENNGISLENCVPKIYTDSKELSFLEKTDLKAKVECIENGVIVRIYKV